MTALGLTGGLVGRLVDDPIEFEVTADDVEHGEQGDSETCAFARAIHRATGEYVVVDTLHVFIGTDPSIRIYRTTPEIAAAINGFDRGERIRLGAYRLITREV